MPHNDCFLCSKCDYKVACCVAREITPRFSVSPMICSACQNLSNYIDTKFDKDGYPTKQSLVCNYCSKTGYLLIWKRYSCPKCSSKMRAYGRSFFWQNESECNTHHSIERS